MSSRKRSAEGQAAQRRSRSETRRTAPRLRRQPLAGTRFLNAQAPPRPRDIRETLTIKRGDAFLLTDLMGNIPEGNTDGLGLYAQDTRFLSGFELVIEGLSPTILLSSSHASFLAEQVLTNPNLVTPDGQLVPEQTIAIRRYRRLLSDGARESLTVENFNRFPIRLTVAFRLAADFADIFEVRGLVERQSIGASPITQSDRELLFHRRGRDGLQREARIAFEPRPGAIEGGTVTYLLDLPARGAQRLTISIALLPGAPQSRARRAASPVRSPATVETSSSALNDVLRQSRRDLEALMSSDGPDAYVAAGIPWYAALFGRDAIITALFDLWLNPALARQTLTLLALKQADHDDPWRDEEPGKILHELRCGELARLGQVPFTPYFGTIDATPLWVMLLSEYCQATCDHAFAQEMRPHLERALTWIDRYGDLDGDGFVEYRRRSGSGLIHQGWKDSWDGIAHADGSEAEPPIALVEVQGYVYAAKRGAAGIYRALGDAPRAEQLDREASALQAAFEEAFWMPDEQFYCLALDGRKRQVKSITSNPGHALLCGLVSADRAEAVARRLTAEDLFSGWGIRTLSSRTARYNPTGYHTGTVWPHDNAVIALGLKRYGFDQAATGIAEAMLDAARLFPANRMPELFCGFARSAFGMPVRYPVACSPQAWAAASCGAFLRVMLGLQPNARASELRIVRPRLPRSLAWVRVTHVAVGRGEIDLYFQRGGADHTSVDVSAMRGDVRVAIVDRWSD